MATSSKNGSKIGQGNPKIIFLKSSELYRLRNVHTQEHKPLIVGLKTVRANNIPVINPVYTNTLRPVTSTIESPLQPPKYVVLNKNNPGLAVLKTNLQKVPALTHFSETNKPVALPSLSNAGTNIDTASLATRSNGSLNAETTIELDNPKKLYDDTDQPPRTVQSTTKPLHIQIPDTSTTQLPCDVHQYKRKEEEFIEQLDREEQAKSNEDFDATSFSSYLDYDLQPFTRQELKRLPDKIFASPVESAVKQENGVKEAKIHEIDLKQDPKQSVTCNEYLFLNVSGSNSNNSETETTEAIEGTLLLTENPDSGKQTFEIILNTSDGENLEKDNDSIAEQNYTDSYFEPSEELEDKKVAIADEDAVIIKEIDKFIEEIRSRNNLMSADTERKSSISKIKENFELDKYLQGVETKQTVPELNSNLDAPIKDDSSAPSPASKESVTENLPQPILNKVVDDIVKDFDITKLYQNKTDDKEICAASNKIKTQVEINSGKDDIDIKEVDGSFQQADEATEINFDNNEFTEDLKGVSITENQQVSEVTHLTLPETCKSRPEGNAVENKTVNAGIQTYVSDDITRVPDSTTFGQDLNACSILVLNEKGVFQPLSIEESKTVQEQTVGVNKEEILVLLEKARSVTYDTGNGLETLKSMNTSLKEHIRLVKELCGKLETSAEAAVEELKKDLRSEDVSTVRDNLNFIKTVMEKCFAKESKKQLKYKVVSITKKQTKVTPKRNPKQQSDKLLQRTMRRVNKLLNVLEKNPVLLLKDSKQKMLLPKQRQKQRDCKRKETNSSDLENQEAVSSNSCAVPYNTEVNWERVASSSSTNSSEIVYLVEPCNVIDLDRNKHDGKEAHVDRNGEGLAQGLFVEEESAPTDDVIFVSTDEPDGSFCSKLQSNDNKTSYEASKMARQEGYFLRPRSSFALPKQKGAVSSSKDESRKCNGTPTRKKLGHQVKTDVVVVSDEEEEPLKGSHHTRSKAMKNKLVEMNWSVGTNMRI